MHIDWLFVGAGIVVLCLACVFAFRTVRRFHSQEAITVLLWALFGVGLLIQGFAPHLQIQHNAFVAPTEAVLKNHNISAIELVGREREMEMVSSLLLIGASLGLAYRYRGLFFAPRAPPGKLETSDR
jgi:hypothetical protein